MSADSKGDATSIKSVKDYAAKLALEIDKGTAPGFVLWSAWNKVHVVIGRALPPENLPSSLSLAQWRELLRTALVDELVKLGWRTKGGNRFRYQGTSKSEQERRRAYAAALKRPTAISSAYQGSVDDRSASYGLGRPARKALKRGDSNKKVPTAVWVVLGVIALIAWLVSSLSDSPELSHSTRQKIYYDIAATQDLNPDSTEYNEAVKEAAAEYYNVPMEEINEIIHDGASEGWLLPDPP